MILPIDVCDELGCRADMYRFLISVLVGLPNVIQNHSHAAG